MRFIVDKIRPGRGFAHVFHLSFLALLPPVLLLLVALDFNLLALLVLLLSKWRMLALHPRHWLAHIRTNAVDIIVGLSVLALLIASSSLVLQLIWVVLFEIWLLVLKPREDSGSVALQALIAQAAGLASIFLVYETISMILLVVVFWAVSYFSARHFFNAFEEVRGHLYAAVWAFFSAALIWVLSHWLLFVGPLAQPALITVGLGYGLAALYYLDRKNRLSAVIRRQILLTVFALLFVLIVFSDWSDKTV